MQDQPVCPIRVLEILSFTKIYHNETIAKKQ